MSWNGMDYDDRTDRFNRALCLVEEDAAAAVKKWLAGDDNAQVDFYDRISNRVAQMPVKEALIEFLIEYDEGEAALVDLLRGKNSSVVHRFVKKHMELWGEDLAESMVTA